MPIDVSRWRETVSPGRTFDLDGPSSRETSPDSEVEVIETQPSRPAPRPGLLKYAHPYASQPVATPRTMDRPDKYVVDLTQSDTPPSKKSTPISKSVEHIKTSWQGAWRSPPAHGLSAKQRVYADIKADSAKRGIPIGSPQLPELGDAWRKPPRSNDGRGFDFRDDDAAGNAFMTTEAALRELIEGGHKEIKFDSNDHGPEGLVSRLLFVEIMGYQWLKGREAGKNRGGILADEMGLGKTVQMISLILANKPSRVPDEKTGKKPPRGTLVVAPLGLLHQWKAEIGKMVEAKHRLKVCLHHGPRRTKDPHELAKYDVVLTNYDTLTSELFKRTSKPKADKGKPAKKMNSFFSPQAEEETVADDELGEAERGPLFDTVFHRVILDEAHTIKNRNARKSKASYQLQARYRWCLTGTPIQNSVEDMFSIFKFLGPGVCKPMHDYQVFRSNILDPMKRNQGVKAIQRLQAITNVIQLRRRKDDKINGKPLLILPARQVHVIETDFLDPDERAFYDAIQTKAQIQMNKFAKQDAIMSNYASVLSHILRMRQATSHPHLITKGEGKHEKAVLEYRDPKAADDDMDDLADAFRNVGIGGKNRCRVCEAKIPSSADDDLCRDCKDDLSRFKDLDWSTKVQKTISVLRKIRKEEPGRKTIIFSQFTSMFDLLQPFLEAANFKYVRYDGTLHITKKNTVIQNITDDPKTSVILVSLKAGAVGLNLTACSKVILLDLWWNPAIENQAIDRAHRLGQKYPVDVYKIVIKDTIEQRILNLQEEKAKIADASLDGGSAKDLQKLNKRDVMRIFDLEKDSALGPSNPTMPAKLRP